MSIADSFRLVWTPFLKMQGRTALQAVGLVCPPVLGSGGELGLQVGNWQQVARKIDLISYPEHLHTLDKPRTYLWLVPRPKRPVPIKALWRTSLGRSYRASLLLHPAEPRRIHVVFKTHIDLGYTAPFKEVMRLYRTRLLEALLENLDRTAGRKPGRRFVWTLSTWLLEQCLDPRHTRPEYVRRLEHYIRAGQVVWGLMPFTTHSEFFGIEEMCRSIYAARRLAERYGVPVPQAAKMTDVPAHTSALAMAFAAAGGRFFQIGTNPDSRPPEVPPLFWWDLPDGQKLLCHYHATYGTPLLPPQDWPWKNWLSIQMTSDNVGPQNLDLLDHTDWIEKHFDYPVCRTGRLEDFASAVRRDHGHDLPVFNKELTDWWIHGIASQAGPTALARRTKDRLAAVETLATAAAMSRRKDVNADLRSLFTQAYEKLALYTEHTWGDHSTDGRKLVPRGRLYNSNLFLRKRPPPPVDRWVASWKDKAAFATQAHQRTDQAEANLVRALSSGRRSRSNGPGILLLNPLPWARTAVVRVADRGLPSGEFDLLDRASGASVTYERRRGMIEFVAPLVPPCGYLYLEAKPVACRVRPGRVADWSGRSLTLHTADESLQFHAAGGLCRWFDRARSMQWCHTDSAHPLGAYVYEMPGGRRLNTFAHQVHTNCWEGTAGYFHRYDYDRMSQFGPVGGSRAVIRPEITSCYARVVVEADCPARRAAGRRSGDGRRYRTTFTQYRDRPELHVNIQLFGKQPSYAAEAGYVVFPINLPKPRITVERISRLVVPARDLALACNAAMMAVHHGVRVEGRYTGMNLYPLDTPLVCFGGPGAYVFDAEHEFDNGVLYAMLFNNGWNTNFALWQGGDFSFDFVLQPTANDARDGGLSRGGYEFHRPVMATVVAGFSGPPSRSLLTIESAGVQLVVLKAADFGPGVVLRLWNAHAETAHARLVFPEAARHHRLRRCDLLERPNGRALRLSPAGEATVTLKPHEIATYLLHRP
ncbi:MAG: glycosyl hydrolase-related protein [Phycisphaerae bacterium]|nr:glycosyl hydrolase-related protein [Phycisphaerae bacterium]